ncbi:hypothetical protein LUZ61_014668 [Rhynchospora tenuis]|uniref:Nucleobase-ascorbate transporter 3 n=1 Tax=Rhynchospora tenuis TaxID=198213 RepID=A0AAD5WBR1_9POAL|nr:hypothetical protein LUZ61_014668 [Rhynchospora tenuis]
MGESNIPPPTAPPPMMVPPGGVQVGAGAVFPPNEQLLNLPCCVHSNPSWAEVAVLAFMHYLVMLGSVVMISSLLVPQMGGNNGDKARVIQTVLFMSGINTLLQTLIGTRLPTVMGPSFAFIISVQSVIRDYSSHLYQNEHQRFLHTIRAIQGALIVASCLNIVLGYSKAWWAFVRKFSPVTIVPVVCVVGLGLLEWGFPQVGKCVEIGLPMLILLVVVQQYLKYVHEIAYKWIERYTLLLCIFLVWTYAAILTAAGAYNHASLKAQQHCRTDRSHLMSSAPWIKIPYPFQWGTPIFSASHSFGMMGAVLVAAVESTGAYFAAARLSGATPPPAFVISRSVGLQGIGMFLEGIFGTIGGSTASVENIGLLGLTKVGSRRVIQVSTGFMIFFSIFGKFGAFFASIPLSIFAAAYCVLFGIVAAVGISFTQFLNNNSMRNMYIVGLSLFLGVSIPQYFNEYRASAGDGPARSNAGWFNDILNTLFSSAVTVAIIVATLLDNTLEMHNSAVDRDRGIPWWAPFQRRSGEVRNDEFYGYPIKIHDWMPSRYMH